MNNDYIKSMSGFISRARGYGQDGFELRVRVSFDAVQFNKLRKVKQDPLANGMAQIKNVVLDTTGIRGIPSYSPLSYSQRYPRASKGLITLDLYFDVSEYTLKANGLKDGTSVDLNAVLERTRNDGHLLAKAVIAERMGN